MTDQYELFSISGHYILYNKDRSLWCSKLNGSLTPSNSNALDVSLEPVCLGLCYGIVGKIQFLPDSPENLVLIADRKFVCDLHGHPVYRINDIVILPLSLETPELQLQCCPSHPAPPRGTKVAETDAKIERKLEEEFVKWFEKSFYYSLSGDITHNLTEISATSEANLSLPLWKRVKERYFWNLGMLDTFISSYSQFADVCDPWIIPVMQGYVETKNVEIGGVSGLLHTTLKLSLSTAPPATQTATLTIISRRSKYRAGTRFKRRGIDAHGNPANYVETEQLLSYGGSVTSYTIVRGSVPVYWYQPLTNYRPKPVILKCSEESLEAFKIHMDSLLSQHNNIVIVNLLDAEGKEAQLGDEYAKVAYMYNNEFLTYVAFDFNEYCSGMKYDNVSALLKELDTITNNYHGFTHTKDNSTGKLQEGAIRVNCMDSLDRTNVVQGSIARSSLLNQALFLNLPPNEISNAAKILWANNGDAISTQYAGTAALKGDYTRTGERGVAGMMRDGVSSVTRMYINVFRDTNRQAAIDIMQQLEPELLDIQTGKNEELDCIPGLLEEGQKYLPTADEGKQLHRSWICQDYSTGKVCGVWLSAQALEVVADRSRVSLPLVTCDRLQIGQPPDSIGHYIRVFNGKTIVTVRPLCNDTTQLQDGLMRMAHAIVSCRDDLGISTQVQHGPLSKPSDLMDVGFDKIKSSANTFGTKLAAGAKRMIGEAKGVLDSRNSSSSPKASPKASPKSSPRFGRRMLSMFKRDDGLTEPTKSSSNATQPPPIKLSDVRKRSLTAELEQTSETEANGEYLDAVSVDDEDEVTPVRSALSETDLIKLVEMEGRRDQRSNTFHSTKSKTLRNTKSKSSFVFISIERDDTKLG